MSRLEQEMRITAQLLQARDALRSLWGAHYDEKIAPWRKAVRELAAALECQPLLVPVRLPDAERPDGFGMVAMFAAALDETERAA